MGTPLSRFKHFFSFVEITLTLLVLLVSISLIHQFKESQLAQVGKEQQMALEVAYRATLETYRLEITTRFNLQLQHPELLDLMELALAAPEQAMPSLRGKLYRMLRPLYVDLKENGLEQFQFHLADDRVLLRFQMPENAGDKLFAIRPLLRQAMETRQSLIGFEIGHYLSSFRHIYPLAREGKLLGAVEISLPFNHFRDNMAKLLPKSEFGLLLKRSVIESIVEPSYQENYTESIINPDFMRENPTLSRVAHHNIQSEPFRALRLKLKTDDSLRLRMAQGLAFAIPLIDQDKGYVVSLLPIPGNGNQNAAYVVRFTPTEAVVSLRTAASYQSGVAVFMILSLALVIHLLRRQNLHLADSEKRFHALFESSRDAIFLQDGATIIDCNHAGLEILGASKSSQVIGHTPAEFSSDDPNNSLPAVERVAEKIRAAIAGIPQSFEWPTRQLDGTEILLDLQLSKIDINGKVHLQAIARDITERKKAEQDLKESWLLLQTIIDNVPMRVFWKDRDLRYFGCNPQFALDAGKNNPKEIIGKTDFELGWKDQAEQYRADDIRIMASGIAELGYEELQTTPDGRIIWLLTSKVPLRNHAGQIIGILGIYADITERKQVEQQLRESEFFLRESQQIGQLGGWRANPVQNTVMWTEGVYAITEEPLDFKPDLETALDAYKPDSRIKVSENLHRTLQTGQPFSIQVEIIGARTGLHKWCELRGFPHYDAEKRIDYVTGTLQDITGYIVSEQKLRESEIRYRNLAENSADWIWAMDVEGKHTYSTDRVSSILGFSLDEFKNCDPIEIVHPDDREQFITTFEQARATRTGWSSVPIRWRTESGGYKTLESSASPIFNEEGQLTGFQGVDRDVTERILAEQELIRHRNHLEELVKARTLELATAKEAAEAANRAKSTFLANMSHELRTPMNGIMGMNDLLLRRETDPGKKAQLSKIQQASTHLLGVINDILDISKIEAERLTLEVVTFKLGEILENISSLIAHKAADKQIGFSINLSPEVAHLSLRGDPLRIAQILLNLTGNALKFTEQGAISLNAKVIQETETDTLIRFEVNDTGIGISSEDQKRLFTAFEQADGSMTRKYGGTGLGLAISKRLVHLMDGTIGVDSRVGHGSSFWFTARLDKAELISESKQETGGLSAEERLKSQFANTRILLAEDEPISQEVARGLLEAAGLQVDLAEDGLAAVTLAQHNHYALILMDMQMPNMNGIDATRWIRTLPGYTETPILAMTANAFDEDRQVCLAAGMNDHIGKPVNPVKLFETLLAWLSMRRA